MRNENLTSTVARLSYCAIGPMDSTSFETKLLRSAVAGDPSAIQRLLLHHHDRLVGIVTSKLPNELKGVMSPEDICQEVYISAVRAINSFKPAGEGSFFAWLRTIADRKITDALRNQRAVKRGGKRAAVPAEQDTSSVVGLLELLAVHERTPSRSIARREVVNIMQDAIAKLPDDYQEVIRWRYIQGLSVVETAERMERSEGAIKMLCARAMSQLALQIGDPSHLLSRSR